MATTHPGRKLSPLWLALIIAAILILIAYSFIFWSPGEPVEEGDVVPPPVAVPQ